jgi:hypothetical protein
MRDDETHGAKRTVARVLGLLLTVTGAIFLIAGAADFFASFGDLDAGPPTKFWMCFVGVPLLGIGTLLLKVGFLGTVVNYASREVAPGVGHLAEAVSRGIRDGISDDEDDPEDGRRCPSCGEDNDHDAKFCSGCGTAIGKTKACPSCGEMNDADARFCDECGQRYT